MPILDRVLPGREGGEGRETSRLPAPVANPDFGIGSTAAVHPGHAHERPHDLQRSSAPLLGPGTAPNPDYSWLQIRNLGEQGFLRIGDHTIRTTGFPGRLGRIMIEVAKLPSTSDAWLAALREGDAGAPRINRGS